MLEDHLHRALQQMAQRGWVSLNALASILGVSAQALHQRRDKIHTVRVGGINRVSEQEFLRILDNERNQTRAQVIKDFYFKMRKMYEGDEDDG